MSILLYYNKALPEALAIANTMEKNDSNYYFHGDSDVGFVVFSGLKQKAQSERCIEVVDNLVVLS